MDDKQAYAEIGRRIRDKREDAAMTQTQLGALIHISTSEMSRIEGGRRKVTITELRAIGRHLDTSLLYLLAGEDSTSPPPPRRPLPPEAKQEVEDFISYIWEKYRDK